MNKTLLIALLLGLTGSCVYGFDALSINKKETEAIVADIDASWRKMFHEPLSHDEVQHARCVASNHTNKWLNICYGSILQEYNVRLLWQARSFLVPRDPGSPSPYKDLEYKIGRYDVIDAIVFSRLSKKARAARNAEALSWLLFS